MPPFQQCPCQHNSLYLKKKKKSVRGERRKKKITHLLLQIFNSFNKPLIYHPTKDNQGKATYPVVSAIILIWRMTYQILQSLLFLFTNAVHITKNKR